MTTLRKFVRIYIDDDIEADTVETKTIIDGNSGNSYTVDSLGSGFPSVSDSGLEVLPAPSDINFGNSLSVTDDTDGTVTVDASVSAGTADQITKVETVGLAPSGVDKTGDGSDDDFISYTPTVAANRTVTLRKWGIRLTGGTTDSNVVLSFRDDTFTSQATINAGTAPNIARPGVTIATSSDTFVELRLDNNGSNDYYEGADPAIKFDAILDIEDT